ncbi:putative reverse transcriptase domain-containing protein [Tanacetum coccineum]
MAISTIFISSDSSEESVGTPSGRVLWFDDDAPDTPLSPTHDIPPVEVAPPTGQIRPAPFGVHRRRVTIVSPGQPIPYGRPYRYHPKWPVHMMTARKRVGPLPTHRLALRHSVDYSSSYYFTSDDSSRDSPSDSSSETPSDSSSDALSDSSSGQSSSDHSSPTLPSGMGFSHQLCLSIPSFPHSSAAITERPSHSSYVGPSCKRSRSPTTSVLVSSPVPRALSSVRADLLPPRKRIRSSESATDLEDCSDKSSESSVPRETSLRDDVDGKGSDEPYSEPDIDLEVQVEIDECIAYVDALRAEGIDARVVVETVTREEVETSARGTVKVIVDKVTHPVVLDDIPEPAQEKGAIEVTYETLGDLVQRFHDHTMEIPVHRVQVIKSIQRDQRHKIVVMGQQSDVQSERISELEWDNTRLRGMLDVASQRVTRFQCRELCVQRETRQIRRLALEARDTARNLEPLAEGGDEQGGKNGDYYEGGNRGGYGNGNGNRRVNGNRNGGERQWKRQWKRLPEVPATQLQRDGWCCTRLVSRSGDSCCHISNCPQKNQVKYATCTLLDSALTWWNTHKRTIGIDVAYAMTWIELMKLMTEVYCPRNKIQKMETEMVSDEEDKVERFIGGLPDNIQGNVIAAEPTRLQEAIRIANNLMDQKLKGYARSAENKRRKDCPKLRNQNRGNKTGNKIGNKTGNNKAITKAYAIGGGGANLDSNVVTCTFLLNNCYASMLFDSGADRSFVSSTFSALLDVAPSTLDTSYAIELVNGRISKTNVILRGCTLGLLGHPFDIDLMPIELGSFDVIIGMDWLAKYHAVIVCDEKIIRIPYGDETLII